MPSRSCDQVRFRPPPGSTGEDADEDARERIPSAFWSMTIPTDVSPLCSGMNHAHPVSSARKGVEQMLRMGLRAEDT